MKRKETTEAKETAKIPSLFMLKGANELLPLALREKFETAGPMKKEWSPLVIARYSNSQTGFTYYMLEGFYVMRSDWKGETQFSSGIFQNFHAAKKVSKADEDNVLDFCFYGFVNGFEAEFGNVSASQLLLSHAARLDKDFRSGTTLDCVLRADGLADVADKYKPKT